MENTYTPEQKAELINSVCKALESNEKVGNYSSVKNLAIDKLTLLLKSI